MPTIQDANTKITSFPNKFVSPWGNDAITPFYSSMPLKTPVEGCLECIVCGTSVDRTQIVADENLSRVQITNTYVPSEIFTGSEGDQDWGNILNWTDNNGAQSTLLPNDLSEVEIQSSISTNSSGTTGYCYSLTTSNNASISGTSINCIQEATFNGSSTCMGFDPEFTLTSPITYFKDESFCNGNVFGDVVFSDTAVMNGFIGDPGEEIYVEIHGDVIFTENSEANYGKVFGNVDVYSPAQNPIWLTEVTGTITYHGY